MKRHAALAIAAITLTVLGPFIPLTRADSPFPEKSLQLIVPYPAGGAGDILARLVGSSLEARLGKPVVILNRAGGGTIIGAREAAAAPPDGHTMFISSNSTFTLLHAAKDKVPFDSAKDFEPVAQLASISMVLVTYADNPIKDLAGLIDEAKRDPGKLVLASFGGATISHFAGELFKSAAGIKMAHVPYKGSAPAMNDLIGKHITYHVDTVVAVRPQIEAGKVRALAVFSAKRSPFLPDVPTLAELGYKGIDLSSWVALVLPKGVPADVQTKIGKATQQVMQDEAVLARLKELGFESAYARLDGWTGRINEEVAQMKKVAQEAGIRAE